MAYSFIFFNILGLISSSSYVNNKFCNRNLVLGLFQCSVNISLDLLLSKKKLYKGNSSG